jgi:putative ABC transport system permease protein
VINHYINTALRNGRRHWITTTVNILGLTLGFACLIAALGVVNYFSLDDTFYSGANRTYVVMGESTELGAPGKAQQSITTPWVLADSLRAQVGNDGVARITKASSHTAAIDGRLVELRTSFADQAFLDLFPLPFANGNVKQALIAPNSAVVSEAAAIRLFGRKDVVGKTILIDGKQSISISGVVQSPPQPSHIGDRESTAVVRFELLVSMDMLNVVAPPRDHLAPRPWDDSRGPSASITYIRLKEGANSFAQLTARLAEYTKAYPTSENRYFVAYPLVKLRQLQLAGELNGLGLSWQTMLSIIAVVVLMASCLNYANLATAIQLSRNKELGLRRAIGAHIRHLVVQSLVETTMHVALALTASALVVLAVRPLVVRALDVDVGYAWLHAGDLWIALSIAVASVTMLAGLLPTLLISRTKITVSLHQSRGEATKHPAARWLVSAQFFLVSALLIGILIVKSQHNALRDYALRSLPEAVLTIDNNLQNSGVSYDTLRNELRLMPGIAAVSGASFAPWGVGFDRHPLSKSLAPQDQGFPVMGINVAYGYFDSMKIETIAGRSFDQMSETFTRSRNIESVIDRTTARALGFENPQAAIGSIIYPGSSLKMLRDLGITLNVVGVVEDKAWQFSSGDSRGTVYQRPVGHALTPIIRLDGSHLTQGIASVDSVWRKLAPNFALRRTFLDERIERYIYERNVSVRVVAWLTTLAVLIAVSGLVGMSVHMATGRRHEIGVRKTLGARTTQIASLLLKDCAKPVIIGNIFAWPIAFLSTQGYVEQFVHKEDLSIVPFAIGLGCTLGIASIAVMWQTMRAARLNPANVLRHE